MQIEINEWEKDLYEANKKFVKARDAMLDLMTCPTAIMNMVHLDKITLNFAMGILVTRGTQAELSMKHYENLEEMLKSSGGGLVNKYMEMMLLQAREIHNHNNMLWDKVGISDDAKNKLTKDCPLCVADEAEAKFRVHGSADCTYCPLLNLAKTISEERRVLYDCNVFGSRYLKRWEEMLNV